MSEQEGIPAPEGQQPEQSAQPQETQQAQQEIITPAQPIMLDGSGQFELLGAANWGMFIAIVILILAGLMILISLFAGVFMGEMSRGMFGIGNIVAMLLMTAFYVIPGVLLLNFSNSAKASLRENNAAKLNDSLKNLRRNFKFAGILLIIFLSLYILVLVIIGALGASLLDFLDLSQWI